MASEVKFSERSGQGGWSLTRYLLLGELVKVVDLALVRSTGAVPKEEPLQGFVTFELIREAEFILFIGELEEVQELGTGLHDWEWGILGVIDEDGDTALHWSSEKMIWWRQGAVSTIGVESEEPVLFLLIGHDIALTLSIWRSPFILRVLDGHFCLGPFCAIDVFQFLEHDLNFLPIGRVHGDEVKTLASNFSFVEAYLTVRS